MATTVGRYELIRELGRGGMAEVFLARRRGPGGVEKRLALKRIRRDSVSDPRLLRMFVHEARLSMTLAHKNIVPMFDFGRVGDELFLVMEYVEGADLAAALAGATERAHPLESLLAAFIANEACQALDYAHRARDEEGALREIVHRDVTPRNVLLTYTGEVKLVDFGVATNETDLGGGGKVRGTPPYMAPEQARGDLVDARSDVFGLGLVLWEMLAGTRAYDASGKEPLLAQARAGRVPPLPDTVPDGLRTIVETATALEPNDRYESARAMQLALDRFLVSAREPGTAPPAHLLGEWLTEVVPPRRLSGEVAVAAAPVDGPVATFLDDGVDRITTMAAGETTMRSVAETAIESDVPEDEAPDEPKSEPDDEPASAPPRPESAPGISRRAVLGVVTLAGLGAAAALVASVVRGSPSSTAAAPDARAVAISIDAAPIAVAAPIDAASPVVDASAVPDARDRRTGPTPPRPPAASADAGAVGAIRVSASPWARVTVIGRAESCVETPCELTLPAGTHRLRLENPVANVGTIVEVTVREGETRKVVETLTRPLAP